MLDEILVVFVDIFTVDGKYPVPDCENLQLPIQMQLSEKRKKFSEFFVPFLKSTSNFNHFGKKDDSQILLRPLSKKRCFRTRFHSQLVKPSQILAKSPSERFYQAFLSLSRKLVWKMSPLVLGEVLVVFANRLNVDGKYPVHDSENLQLPTQMQVSEKRNYLRNEKFFLNFFLHFMNLHQILNILKKMMIFIANVFPKLQTAKMLLRPLSKKRRFRTSFDSELVKASEILAKSPREHFDHVPHHFQGS